jgi:hypothetical protein
VVIGEFRGVSIDYDPSAKKFTALVIARDTGLGEKLSAPTQALLEKRIDAGLPKPERQKAMYDAGFCDGRFEHCEVVEEKPTRKGVSHRMRYLVIFKDGRKAEVSSLQLYFVDDKLITAFQKVAKEKEAFDQKHHKKVVPLRLQLRRFQFDDKPAKKKEA